jgi:hypothetical protein
VEGLPRGDQIDGSVAEGGGFRPSVDAVEAAGVGEIGLGHRRHLAIGLHAVHHVPVLDEEARQDPVPDPTSATTWDGCSPRSLRSASTTAGG